MEINIEIFNSESLISHTQYANALVLTDTLKADNYCVSETYLRSRNSVQFTGYNINRKGNKTGASLLVRNTELIKVDELQYNSLPHDIP